MKCSADEESGVRIICRKCRSPVVMTKPNETGTVPVPICEKCGVLFFDEDYITIYPGGNGDQQ